MKAGERRARDLVETRSGGICEICGEARAGEWQHRKRRSQGGPWSAVNGLAVCSACHRRIHAEPSEARAYGWEVKSHMDPAVVPAYLRMPYGWHYVWLHEDGTTERAPWSIDLANILNEARGTA